MGKASGKGLELVGPHHIFAVQNATRFLDGNLQVNTVSGLRRANAAVHVAHNRLMWRGCLVHSAACRALWVPVARHSLTQKQGLYRLEAVPCVTHCTVLQRPLTELGRPQSLSACRGPSSTNRVDRQCSPFALLPTASRQRSTRLSATELWPTTGCCRPAAVPVSSCWSFTLCISCSN